MSQRVKSFGAAKTPKFKATRTGVHAFRAAKAQRGHSKIRWEDEEVEGTETPAKDDDGRLTH